MFGLFTKSENKRLDAVRERAKKLADKPKASSTVAKATKRKAAAKATAKKAAGGSYKIKSGDTLSQIAKSKGTTLKALMAANPSIKNANRIRVGQTIKIPSGNKSSNPYKGMTRSEMKGLDSQKQNPKSETAEKRARSATRNANMRSATEKNRKLVRKTVTKKKAK